MAKRKKTNTRPVQKPAKKSRHNAALSHKENLPVNGVPTEPNVPIPEAAPDVRAVETSSTAPPSIPGQRASSPELRRGMDTLTGNVNPPPVPSQDAMEALGMEPIVTFFSDRTQAVASAATSATRTFTLYPNSAATPRSNISSTVESSRAAPSRFTNQVNQSGDEGSSSQDEEDDEDTSRPKSATSLLEDMASYARVFCRLGSPFQRIGVVVEKGVEWELDRDEVDDGSINEKDLEDLGNVQDIILRRQLESWFLLCKTIPGFRRKMMRDGEVGMDMQKHPKCCALQEAVNQCRANDTGRLKSACFRYINKDTTSISPELTGEDDGDKKLRGWSHPQMARLLLPIEYEPSETNFALAKNRRLNVTHNSTWMRMFYPDDHIYKPDHDEDGLFQGHYPIRVFRHIYTAPSSVFFDPTERNPMEKSSKANNAQLMGISALTPRSAGYGIAQARFAISDQRQWSRRDRKVDCEALFWNVVDTLSGKDGKVLLDQINLAIFGIVETSEGDDTPQETPIERIRRQRQERAQAI
ncbi:hypothetical protein QCA50_016978 [Cerrena zonata]|uniref:HNH nuclease domain-containing protein n=1 Tax=Cerrena zonata TaxID=2478898 RepID=A0AAW0FIF4_9APHY